MDAPLEVTIYEDGKVAYQANLDGAVEFGRQNVDEAAPYAQHDQSGTTRVVIARLDEVTIPRKLLRVDRVAADKIKLANPSRVALRLDAGPPLDPGASRDIWLPVTIAVGGKSLTLRWAGAGIAGGRPAKPRRADARSVRVAAHGDRRARQDHRRQPGARRAVALDHRGARRAAKRRGHDRFLSPCGAALVDLVGLDFGCVLLREHDRWVVHNEGRAGHTGTSGPGKPARTEWQPSRQVLDSVYRQKRTFWQNGEAAAATASLVGVKSVVASPILSAQGDVIGVLYGERRRGGAGAATISRLVAMLVEILAGGVAAGLARLEQEQAALRARVLMEQFFTAELSRHLAENPDLLTGRDADVTMLSCDIRGFSRICNNLGPTRTLEWVQNALGTLSDCVLNEQGVLVDYVGDELLAMWGAPGNQPDHAQRACRAALAMLAAVPVLNARWLNTVGEPMAVSIGISSGTARVGNIGSERKFKYGALGTTVNLASRVQGATKYLKVPVLITGAVHERLDRSLRTRRLCLLEVVNIGDPVTVYELADDQREDWADLKDRYEEALARFEKQQFREAARMLGELLAHRVHRDDGPSLVLMQRAVTHLVEAPKQFNPVWKLADKGK